MRTRERKRRAKVSIYQLPVDRSRKNEFKDQIKFRIKSRSQDRRERGRDLGVVEGNRLPGRPRTCCGDYVSHPAWEPVTELKNQCQRERRLDYLAYTGHQISRGKWMDWWQTPQTFTSNWFLIKRKEQLGCKMETKGYRIKGGPPGVAGITVRTSGDVKEDGCHWDWNIKFRRTDQQPLAASSHNVQSNFSHTGFTTRWAV